MFNREYSSAASRLNVTGDKNYCAPVALALTTGMDVELVNDEVIKKGWRRKKCGMSTWNMIRFLDHHRIDHEEIQFNGDSKGTMSTIGKRFPRGKFLVFVRGHVAALVDGEVQDWTEGRRHRVIRLERVGAIPKAVKPVAPKVRKPRGKTSKSQQMLAFLELGHKMTVAEMAVHLDTSIASVRCYVNYFNGGKRGHQQVTMSVIKGIITLG
jgi:hypothetical protein